MKEDIKKYDIDPEVERLLEPRCDFRVSSDFSRKVMSEVNNHAAPKRPWAYRMRYIASAAAAVCLLTVGILYLKSTFDEIPSGLVAGNIEIPGSTGSDSLGNIKQGNLNIAADSEGKKDHYMVEEPDVKKPTESGLQKVRRSGSGAGQYKKQQECVEVSYTFNERAPRIIVVAVGTSPVEKNLSPLDTDSIKVNYTEMRQEEERAYIDYIRTQIESNEDYINRMTALYQTDTDGNLPDDQ